MANQYTKQKEQQAIAERLQRQEEAGIPDSRPPIADTREETWRDTCHVGGLPVSQLPSDLQARLTYAHTDEGIRERDAEYAVKVAEGRISTISIESDTDTERKRFGTMGERLLEGATPEECGNPMEDLMSQHLKPGEVGRWLDPETVDRLGPRGYVPVLDEKGDKVTCGQSFLGKRSVEADVASQRRREQRNATHLAVLQQQVSEQAAQLAHAQRAAGLPVGATGAPHPAGLRISRDIEVAPDARVRGT